MKNIYLLGYPSGACGEFLANLISQDANYYDCNLKELTKENRWIVQSPLNKYGIDMKLGWAPVTTFISDRERQLIDDKFNEKNLVIPSHYCESLSNINLPRLKGVRLHIDDEYIPLFYTLAWLKSHLAKMSVDENRLDLIMISFISNSFNKVKNLIERGYFYNYEKVSLGHGIFDVEEYIEVDYRKWLNQLDNDWDTINLGKLMTDPESVKIKDMLDMTSEPDSNVIREYHTKNIKLIEDTFGMSYNEYVGSNWKSILTSHITTKYPNRY